MGEMELDSEREKERLPLEEDKKLMKACRDIPIAQFVIKEYHRLIHSTQSGWWSEVLEKEEKLFLKYYQMMFEEIKAFWGDAMTNQVLAKKIEFEKIKSCGDDLEKNILLMDIFSQKEIRFDRTGKCDAGKNLNYYPIEEEEDISYGEVLVESLGQFFENAYHASEELIAHSGEKNQPCWYRGVCNEDFSLLPGLYRLYYGKKKDQIKFHICLPGKGFAGCVLSDDENV